MKYVLKIYNIWEFGQRVDSDGNPHQEDSIFPAYGQQKDTDRLFILCDGMGGHEAGEVASSTVCSAMSKSIFESAPETEGDFSDENLKKAIADAFCALDALPLGDVSTDKKMGTTMTFLKFHSQGCTIAHMGDSRVYHIRPGKGREDTQILFKTNDHSLVNDLIKVGELTPEEAKLSKQKNIITRAMQPKMERHPKPDVYHTVDIKKGDYFYMCSDGMLEQMEDDNLLFNFSEATGDDENKVKILTQATSQNLDNHSAIIVHVLDVLDPIPLETAISAPVAVKPEPIMAEIDEDSQVERNETERHDVDSATRNEEIPESRLTKSSNDNVISFKNTKNENAKNPFGIKNLRLLRYIVLAFIVVLMAFGIFFVSSKVSKVENTQPDKTENPQKPGKKPHRRLQNNNATDTHPSQAPSGRTDEDAAPSKPSQSSPSVGNSGSNSSVPNKIQNALSSQAAQPANGSSEDNAHNQEINGSNHSNAATGVHLTNVANHDEGVVSSDQQVAADASNKGKKSKKQF